MFDKSRLITRSKLRKRGGEDAPSPFSRNLLMGNLKEKFEGVESTSLEFEDVKEFEFEGFSVVVENGVYAVKYEDAEDGLVIQNLVDENETEPMFPYLFEVDGIEKVLTEEDYLRIKAFIESGNKEE